MSVASRLLQHRSVFSGTGLHWAALGSAQAAQADPSVKVPHVCACFAYWKRRVCCRKQLPKSIACSSFPKNMSWASSLEHFEETRKKDATRKKIGPDLYKRQRFRPNTPIQTVDIYEHCNWLVSAIVHDVVPIVDA